MPTKKPRCDHCKAKIKGMVNTCESNKKKLCLKCRLPENHQCDYDFNTEQKKRLEKTLIKVENEKIIAI